MVQQHPEGEAAKADGLEQVFREVLAKELKQVCDCVREAVRAELTSFLAGSRHVAGVPGPGQDRYGSGSSRSTLDSSTEVSPQNKALTAIGRLAALTGSPPSAAPAGDVAAAPPASPEQKIARARGVGAGGTAVFVVEDFNKEEVTMAGSGKADLAERFAFGASERPQLTLGDPRPSSESRRSVSSGDSDANSKPDVNSSDSDPAEQIARHDNMGMKKSGSTVGQFEQQHRYGMAADAAGTRTSLRGSLQEISWAAERSVKGRAARIVSDMPFKAAFASLVLFNAAWVGYQVDWAVQHYWQADTSPAYFGHIDTMFCVLFALEFALKLFAYRHMLFLMNGWQWNVFELVLVIAQVCEEIFSGDMNSFAMFRIMRTLRIMRLARLIRFITELRKILVLVVNSMMSFCWTLALTFLMIYMLGVMVSQVVADTIRNQPVIAEESEMFTLIQQYGSLGTATLTLYQCVTGGEDWVNGMTPLTEFVSPLLAVVFCVYIAFSVMVMLNLATGIFVEGAQRIIREEKHSKLVKLMSTVFTESGNRGITWTRFRQELEKPGMREFFSQIDMDMEQAQQLYNYLSAQSYSRIGLTKDQFVLHGMRLAGNARACDMALLWYEMRQLQENTNDRLIMIQSSVQQILGWQPMMTKVEQVVNSGDSSKQLPGSTASGGGWHFGDKFTDSKDPRQPMTKLERHMATLRGNALTLGSFIAAANRKRESLAPGSPRRGTQQEMHMVPTGSRNLPRSSTVGGSPQSTVGGPRPSAAAGGSRPSSAAPLNLVSCLKAPPKSMSPERKSQANIALPRASTKPSLPRPSSPTRGRRGGDGGFVWPSSDENSDGEATPASPTAASRASRVAAAAAPQAAAAAAQPRAAHGSPRGPATWQPQVAPGSPRAAEAGQPQADPGSPNGAAAGDAGTAGAAGAAGAPESSTETHAPAGGAPGSFRHGGSGASSNSFVPPRRKLQAADPAAQGDAGVERKRKKKKQHAKAAASAVDQAVPASPVSAPSPDGGAEVFLAGSDVDG